MTLLIFLIVLSILIFVHEAGHFLAARRAGIKVEEFGFGFPPRVWGIKRGETVYSINLLPIGGFVRLYGEDESVKKEKNRSFYHQKRWTRAKVVVAGVIMNFLLAVAAFGIIAWILGIPHPTGKVEIVDVAQNSPAQQAGITQGDVVVSVDGEEVSETQEFIALVNDNKGEEISLTLQRASGEEYSVSVVPRVDPPEGEGSLGVRLAPSTQYIKPPLWQRPFASVWQGVREAISWAVTVTVAVAVTIAQAARGTPPEGLAGPVGIFQITGAIAQTGVLNLIQFLGILSVNLAVLNILPFPALDGGRLLFILVESVFGRRVVPAAERVAHAVGMIIILFLLLLITIHDIGRFFSGGFNFLPAPQ